MFNIDWYFCGDSNSSANFELYKVKLPKGVWGYGGNSKQSNLNGKKSTEITIILDTIKNLLNKVK